ncbi:hypothetical protein BKA70DRAFT_197998 [Coprinopsis sp. MPI-PUGE-AT-0042]|nr:hypothetical protein BKA70DRAFT_197998 [Coprinopsis sp. MPI-PUGE-AT-0042]
MAITATTSRRHWPNCPLAPNSSRSKATKPDSLAAELERAQQDGMGWDGGCTRGTTSTGRLPEDIGGEECQVDEQAVWNIYHAAIGGSNPGLEFGAWSLEPPARSLSDDHGEVLHNLGVHVFDLPVNLWPALECWMGLTRSVGVSTFLTLCDHEIA